MRVSAEDHDSEFYYVIDKNTGKEIDNCLWADDVSGEYEIVCTDVECNVIIGDDGSSVKTEEKTGNIQIVDTRIHNQALG